MKKIEEMIDKYAKYFEVTSNMSEDELIEKNQAPFNDIYASLCVVFGALQVNPEKQIFLTVADLRLARMEEMEKGFELGEQQAIVKRHEGSIAGREVYLVSSGYATGTIDGKNAELRKTQEKQLLAADEVLMKMQDELSKIRSETTKFIRAHEEAKVNRRYLEDFLSAQRATLIFSGREEIA